MGSFRSCILSDLNNLIWAKVSQDLFYIIPYKNVPGFLEFSPEAISAPPPSGGCTCMASIGGLTPFRKEGEDELSLSLAELASVWHLLSNAYMVSFRLRRFELLICCV